MSEPPILLFHGKLMTMDQVNEAIESAVADVIKRMNDGALYYDDINGGQWRIMVGVRATWNRVSISPPQEPPAKERKA